MQLLSLEEIRVRTGGTNPQRLHLHRGSQEAQEHVQQNLNVLSLFLDYFEEKSNRLQENLGTHPLEFETLIEHLLPDPAASEIIRLRTLVMYFRTWVAHEMEPRWPVLLAKK